ncbi:hypothetical protein BH24DEI2_BH24DEI2_12880 [soil metagenome]
MTRSVGLAALTVGLLALTLNRQPVPVRRLEPVRKLPFVKLPRDLRALGLVKDRVYAVDPDALICLGDPVAVRLTGRAVRIEPYCDELMGSVVGLVVA